MNIEQDVVLAPYTTFGIGGRALYVARAGTLADVRAAFVFAKDKNLKTLVLGGGSNLLIADEGFDGLVIKIELAGIEREGDTLIAAAGESWDGLVARAVSEGLWGIENLSGIPGTVGAAPIQNIGAYGSEVKDTIAWVEILDAASGDVRRFTAPECAFGYRASYFKKHAGQSVVLRVAFALRAQGTPNLSYKDLQIAFAATGSQGVSLQDVRTAVLAIRARKFPDLSVEGTAGSFFLNPVVSADAALALKTRYPELPMYINEEGTKVSLAWLLDHVLQAKGFSVGGARLFERQPLVVVAARDAKAFEVRALAQKVKELVQIMVGITIEEEVRILL